MPSVIDCSEKFGLISGNDHTVVLHGEESTISFDPDGVLSRGENSCFAVGDDTRDEMMADDEVAFVAGAMRFIGETIRRIGLGQWRYGAGLEADDPRSKQPFIRFVIGDQNLDLVPWRLIQAALENDDAIASALDAVIEMREQEVAEAAESSD